MNLLSKAERSELDPGSLAWKKALHRFQLYKNRRVQLRSNGYAIPHRSSSVGRGVFCLCSGTARRWSQGSIESEAIENIKDAIREYRSVVDEQLRNEQVREIEVSV
ncbi:MAG: hypothetical protein AB7G68_19490 [Nitrospiraceae bacterium]